MKKPTLVHALRFMHKKNPLQHLSTSPISSSPYTAALPKPQIKKQRTNIHDHLLASKQRVPEELPGSESDGIGHYVLSSEKLATSLNRGRLACVVVRSSGGGCVVRGVFKNWCVQSLAWAFCVDWAAVVGVTVLAGITRLSARA